jgi:hypothetical protein
MKYSNFQLTKTEFSKHGFIDRQHATVYIETGVLWWKKKRTIQIFKKGAYWQELATGNFTEGTKVEQLSVAYNARKALEQA